jgi:hypothetical protein
MRMSGTPAEHRRISAPCRLDRRKYPTGRKVTNEEMSQINIKRDKFHGEWNYVIRPTATNHN